jgi:hypothetical protein
MAFRFKRNAFCFEKIVNKLSPAPKRDFPIFAQFVFKITIKN